MFVKQEDTLLPVEERRKDFVASNFSCAKIEIKVSLDPFMIFSLSSLGWTSSSLCVWQKRVLWRGIPFFYLSLFLSGLHSLRASSRQNNIVQNVDLSGKWFDFLREKMRSDLSLSYAFILEWRKNYIFLSFLLYEFCASVSGVIIIDKYLDLFILTNLVFHVHNLRLSTACSCFLKCGPRRRDAKTSFIQTPSIDPEFQ